MRVKLDPRAGSRLALVPTDAGGFEIHPETASVSHLKGAVPALSRPVTLDEMDEAIATGATTPTR